MVKKLKFKYCTIETDDSYLNIGPTTVPGSKK